MNAAVIGLGKLGLPWAAVLASKGHHVIGVDLSTVIQNLLLGELPVREPQLSDMLILHNDRIRYTTEVDNAVSASDIVFIVVPTPSLDNGEFSSHYVLEVCRTIGEAMKTADHYILVVLTSTVMPGTTSKALQILEDASYRKCGKDFGLCYNPEFIALGSVIRDMMHPDFVLVGQYEDDSGEFLEKFYSSIHSSPVLRMNLVGAEIAKLCINSYVTTKISFANSVSELCERFGQGADAVEVLEALGYDSRIGERYLASGTAYGGPCFPRDNKALQCAYRSVGLANQISNATEVINNNQSYRIATILMRYLERPGLVAVIGIAYKPNTHITEESATMRLIPHLANFGNRIICWDPLATREDVPTDIDMADSFESCVENADAIIFMHGEDVLTIPETTAKVVLDAWGCLVNVPSGIEYVRLGKGKDA